MNTAPLQQLTDLLKSSIPQYYLDALDNYPVSLLTANRAIDDSDSEGTVADVEFMQSPESVLILNREARAAALVQPDGVEMLWPDQFLIIGESGEGDYFCIDARGEVEGVMQYDHQAVEFHVIADTLDEFVESLEDSFLTDGDFDDETPTEE